MSWFRLSFGLCLFEEGYSIHLFGLWLSLKFLPNRQPREMMEKWGFCIDEGSCLHLNWGMRTQVISLPWAWDHDETLVLLPDGSWVAKHKDCYYDIRTGKWTLFPCRKGEIGGELVSDDPPDGRQVWDSPYVYKLNSGEEQLRRAVYWCTRHVSRWKISKALSLPWPKRISDGISVDFDGEVGERAGSWKGGVTGCGYDLKKGETPEECLMRMEVERVFR